MEPTRVAQFDNQMYATYFCGEDVTVCKMNPLELIEQRRIHNEQIEKQIADSHDITKSDMGFK